MEYQSPGGAFTNAMDDFLMRQHMMARQAQQDALTQQREDRITAQQQEEMAMRREEQQARREDLIQRHNERKTADIEKRMSNMVPGDIPDAEMLKHADELGIGGTAFPKPAASLPGLAAVPVGREQVGLTPLAEAPRPFAGSAKQRQDVVDRKTQEDYIGTLPVGPVRTAAEFELKTGRTMPAVAAKTESHSPIYTEYQDYAAEEKKAGRTPLGFNEYATFDANRHKPNVPAGDPFAEVSIGDKMAHARKQMGEQAFDMEAKTIAQGGGYPAYGMMSKGEKMARYDALAARAAQFDKTTGKFVGDGELNPNVPDRVLEKADVHAETANLTELRKSLSGIKAFAEAADLNFKRLDKFVDGIPDFGVSWANRPARDVAQAFGSTKMTDYNILQNSLKSEYTRLINQAKLSGVAIPESARAEMDRGVDVNATIPQIRSAFATLKAESVNRETGMQHQLDESRARLKGGPVTPTKSKYKVSVE